MDRSGWEIAVRAIPRERKRIPSLDGIRGIAVILVLAVHFHNLQVLPETSALSRWAAGLMSWGWCGVDLFFVLSGFLITGVLLDTKHAENRFHSFYGRRILRIFPLYYGVVLLSLVASIVMRYFLAHKTVGPSPTGWVTYLLYVQNWWIPSADLHEMAFLGPFWSLAIEEQFYLIWPLCVWRVSKKALVKICLVGIVGAFLLRWWLMSDATPPLVYVVYMNTLTRMDELLTGGLCAIAVRNTLLLRQLRIAIPIGAVSVVSGLALIIFRGHEAWNDIEVLVYGHLLLAVGFGCLILTAYLSDGRGTAFDRAVRSNWLASFGKYSYGIYIFQGLVLQLLLNLFRPYPWWGHSALYAAAVALGWIAAPFAMAFLSYNLFEKRFLRLKYLFPIRFAEEVD